MPQNRLEKTYPVHSFEVDWQAELRFGTLLDFLQDSAAEDATRRGFGVEQLFARGLTWMLSRYRIRLDARVGLGDRLCIRTWPSLHKGLSSCREFEILRDGVRIGVASTAWMLIDLANRRPVRPKERLGEVFLIDEQVFGEPLSALKFAGELGPAINFRVRRADLDLNRHVNNRVFFDWAVEALDAQIGEHYRLQQVDINYLAEALAGDQVTSAWQRQPVADGLCCSHLIRRPADGKELARLRTHWVPR